jgi:plastocyanin
VSAPARAVLVIAIPSNEFLDYFGTPATVAARAAPVFLVNTDGVPHSVIARAKRPDLSAAWCSGYDAGQCPLFWSAGVTQGYTEVLGIPDTVGGTQYEFYCGVHPTMHATLIVVA